MPADAPQELVSSTWTFITSTIGSIFSKLVISILTLLIGFTLGRLLGKLVQRMLSEAGFNEIVARSTKIHIAADSFVGSVITYCFYLVFIVASLNQLGVGTIFFNVLSGAVVLIITISLFLTIKDFFPNVLSWLFVIRKRRLKPGDHIETDGIAGKVTSISLMDTCIMTSGGDMLYIPNTLLAKQRASVHPHKK
jgi:small-conductance mechanosensitive channel